VRAMTDAPNPTKLASHRAFMRSVRHMLSTGGRPHRQAELDLLRQGADRMDQLLNWIDENREALTKIERKDGSNAK
jgi:hypothetical protein